MIIMKKIKTMGYLFTLSVLFFVSIATAGRIENSKHDFSQENWTLNEQICVVCHAPHASLDDYEPEAPLWNHTKTSAAFIMYSSPTFDGVAGYPDGTSILCLSCHDGTVALDSFGGNIGTEKLVEGDAGFIGTDLSNDHPISFAYTDNVDEGIHSKDNPVTIGFGEDSKDGTISELLLFANKVQCASCHDVHNRYTIPESPLLKISTANSELCLYCHDK